MSMEQIPSSCLATLDSVVQCVVDPMNGNCLPRCFDPAPAGSSLPFALGFLDIPLDAESCAEFEEPFCFPDILPGCCPVCAGVLRRLYRCVALNGSGLDAEVDILARECELDCAEFIAEIDMPGLDLSNSTNTTNSTLN